MADGTTPITLDPRAGLFHFQKPDSTDEQIHIAVEAKRADHQETLTWSFPAFSGDELEFDLVPAGIHHFNPGLYHGDQLFNVEMGVSFEFEVGDGAESVIIRGIEGTAFGHGVRSHRAQPPQGGAR